MSYTEQKNNTHCDNGSSNNNICCSSSSNNNNISSSSNNSNNSVNINILLDDKPSAESYE